jgi:hypothetical protein
MKLSIKKKLISILTRSSRSLIDSTSNSRIIILFVTIFSIYIQSNTKVQTPKTKVQNAKMKELTIHKIGQLNLENFVTTFRHGLMSRRLQPEQFLANQPHNLVLGLGHGQLVRALDGQVQLSLVVDGRLPRRRVEAADGDASLRVFADLSEGLLGGDLPANLLRKVVDLEFFLELLKRFLVAKRL